MRRAGFSLLEAVVALAVLGAVSVSALAAFGAQLRTSERAATALTGDALAEDQLARVRLLDREDLAHLPDSIATGRFDAPWERFSWRVTTRAVVDRPDVFEVTAAVQWESGNYDLSTRLYRPRRQGVAR
jgi:prepilin-type N-terminal cleavage/methylation domain-containing protein